MLLLFANVNKPKTDEPHTRARDLARFGANADDVDRFASSQRAPLVAHPRLRRRVTSRIVANDAFSKEQCRRRAWRRPRRRV
jgi:hypothetical protein